MKSIDLLLVNPNGRDQIYQSLGQSLTAVEPPVWAGLIATFIRRQGFSVQILDANAEGLTPEESAQRILDLNPLLTAVVVYGHQPSASTQNMPAAGAMCRAVKNLNPDLNILLTGGHVAALAEQTLEQEAADFVSIGEGPYTVLDLLKQLSASSPKWDKVRDLWYLKNGKPVSSPETAPLVLDLDHEIPLVAWDLLPMNLYRAHNWHCFGGLDRTPYASIYTTLGCPFHCSFCCIQAPFRSGEKKLNYPSNIASYRFWSPDVVVSQIDRLVRDYGVKNIKIADEMFVLKSGHVNAICDLLIERDYVLNLWAYARVDTIREDMIEKLKRAGANWLALGIESANSTVRSESNKKFEQEMIFKTIQRIRDAGISVIANYIFGLPEDNFETMRETFDLACELNTEFVNFYSAMAYPGSQLFDLAQKEKWPLPPDWSGYSQHSEDTFPLRTRYLSSEEVLAFRDEAFEAYFSREAYLKLIESKFGGQAVEEVKFMNSFKLKRRIYAS